MNATDLTHCETIAEVDNPRLSTRINLEKRIARLERQFSLTDRLNHTWQWTELEIELGDAYGKLMAIIENTEK